jgi:radical SAM protein with 4Fe4S-binding SPASM domain
MFVLTHRPSRGSLEVQSVKDFSKLALSESALSLLSNPADAAGERELAFVALARKRGWLAADDRINGTLRRVEKEPWLRHIQIETALTCNFSCSYCYSGSAPTRREKLSAHEIRDLLQQAAGLAVSEVCFTGGEFLLYPGWQGLIEAARTLGLIVDIHTNGYLLDDRAIEFCLAQGVRQVQVTVESHVARIHDSIRGRHGSWDRVIRNITAARAAGQFVKVVTQVHRKNIATIRETAMWFHERLGQPVNLDRIVGDNNLAVSQAEFWEAVAPLLGLGMRASRICEPSGPSDSYVQPDCGVAADFAYITAEGEIALCPTMTSREDARFAGPNTREMSLAEAWYNSAVFTHYRHVNCENTSRCPAASACKGGCRSNAYAETGVVDAPDVIACNIHKNPTPVFVDFIGRYRAGEYSRV